MALLFYRLLEESHQQLRVSNAPISKEPEVPGQAEGQHQPSSSTWKTSSFRRTGVCPEDGRLASCLE